MQKTNNSDFYNVETKNYYEKLTTKSQKDTFPSKRKFERPFMQNSSRENLINKTSKSSNNSQYVKRYHGYNSRQNNTFAS